MHVRTPGQRQQDEVTIAGNPAPAAPAPRGPFALFQSRPHPLCKLASAETEAWMSRVSLRVFSFSEKLRARVRTSLADSVTNWEFKPELDQSLSASPALTCKFLGPTIQAVRSRDPSTCPDPTPVAEMPAFLLKSDPVASHSSWVPPKGDSSSSTVDWGGVTSKQTAPPQLSPPSPANLSQVTEPSPGQSTSSPLFEIGLGLMSNHCSLQGFRWRWW